MMRIRLSLLGGIISCCHLLYAQDRQESVLLSEVFYDTPLNEKIAASIPYSNGEFIQLFNASDFQINLGNWTLKGDGKTEVFQFPVNTMIDPQSYLIIAYRHIDTPEFRLSDLFSELEEFDNSNNVIYQRKIILSNSGEGIALKNSSGLMIDSIFYDGTSNKSRPDRLSATNLDSTPIDSCLSVQRHSGFINIVGFPNIRRSDWRVGAVAPLGKNINIEKEAGLYYSYDNAGNRISRTIRNILFENKNVQSRSRTIKSTQDEEIQAEVEYISEKKITIYPNPTRGQLAIDIANLSTKKDNMIYCYTSYGQLIVSKKIISERTDIDLKNQPNGTYVLYIIMGEDKSVWKIIKQ